MESQLEEEEPMDSDILNSTLPIVLYRNVPQFPVHLTFNIPRASTRQITDYESIHAAARAGDATAVSLFISRGADLNGVDSMGDAPIHSACTSSRRNQRAVVEVLLANGANPLSLTITGQTVLHLLAVHSKSQSTLLTLRYLVESVGVNINLEDEIKRTPLQYLLQQYRTIRTEKLANIITFFILNGGRSGSEVGRLTTHLVTECSILTSSPHLDLYEHINNLYTNCPNELWYLSHRKSVVSYAENVCRKELFVWGSGANKLLPKLSFLRMSEKEIAHFARREPHLYFAITSQFRSPKITPHSWKILHHHYQAQFNTFCYYFVEEQLKTVYFTNGAVTLNYDCLRTIAQYLLLKDLVNLCVAFSFDATLIGRIRKLNRNKNSHDFPI